MKTTYFSRDPRPQALEMLDAVQAYRQKQRLAFAPERSALIVLDLQKYFVQALSHACVPSAQAIIPGIQSLIGAYSTRGLPRVFTRHLNTPQNAGLMAKWWQDLIRAQDPSSEIIDELDLAGGIVIQKSQYDAFHDTPLADVLRERAVAQVVICGVMTHLCCETTARAAFVRGFEVFFAVDGTATYHEEFHRATLLNLAHGFAIPVLVEEILAAVQSNNAG